MASVGEEYEPISDDELDEILADSQKKEDQQDEEKTTGINTICFYEEIIKCCMSFYKGNYGNAYSSLILSFTINYLSFYIIINMRKMKSVFTQYCKCSNIFM